MQTTYAISPAITQRLIVRCYGVGKRDTVMSSSDRPASSMPRYDEPKYRRLQLKWQNCNERIRRWS